MYTIYSNLGSSLPYITFTRLVFSQDTTENNKGCFFLNLNKISSIHRRKQARHSGTNVFNSCICSSKLFFQQETQLPSSSHRSSRQIMRKGGKEEKGAYSGCGRQGHSRRRRPPPRGRAGMMPPLEPRRRATTPRLLAYCGG